MARSMRIIFTTEYKGGSSTYLKKGSQIWERKSTVLENTLKPIDKVRFKGICEIWGYNYQKALKGIAEKTEVRENLKAVAKEIRHFLKVTGGTFGVRTQENNVIWISGQYASGVPYEERQDCEKRFSAWLADLAKKNDLEFHEGLVHKYLKSKEA